MKLDLPYRWLPITSNAEEENLKFIIPLKESTFEINCSELNIGDKVLLFGPIR